MNAPYQPAAAIPPGGGLRTAFRFALRELRGGLSGFYVFLACIAIGVAAIAGVGSLSRALTDGISREGQVLVGGDISFDLVQRQASAEERAFLDGLGRVSVAGTMRAMLRRADGNDATLVEMKAVDATYPLYGELAIEGGGEVQAALARRADGRYGALAEPALMLRLGLEVGDEALFGNLRLVIAGTIAAEPDRLVGGPGFGPRLMISRAALDDSGLLRPGSLVQWHNRVKLPNGEAAAVERAVAAAEAAFPQAGWQVRSRANAAPRLEQNINRFAQFLTLVGLTALVVGGIGVANAVRAFLDTKQNVIATLKCVGASGGFVLSLYLIQILMIAGIGIAIGLAIGALAPPVAARLLAGVLPFPLAIDIYPRELLMAVAYGLLTALAFALWPLGRASDVPVSALFRDLIDPARRWPKPAHGLATAAAIGLLATLAVASADDTRVAFVYIGASAAAFVILRLVGTGLMAAARRLPRPRSTGLRLALTNIYRPGALTPTVTLSLGLGLALLVTISQIDGNLRHNLTSTLPAAAPSFFFLDIDNGEKDRFLGFLKAEAPGATVESVPMLRGRITALAGVPADEITPPPGAAWVLNGDRGITYSAELPENSTLSAGAWWPADHQGEPLVSFEGELAGELGLKLGDPVSVNVLGREITAKIANFREVEWRSLAINFVMVFSPNSFAGAPHTHLATVSFPGKATTAEEIELLKAVTREFPAVTAVRVKEALQAANDLVGELAFA
ncbi:MAG TPA: FtsX-like permease family protein, partial [Kaistiaceae bacterium]|nr:FtsX-like permease family protein [Kaistiaceae bacterium]